MGDSARTKRREQLKRWAGSCTNKASAVPRRRWRGNAQNGAGEPEAQKRVRFDRAAEFLATCASGDTEEAQLMLKEAKETKTRMGEEVAEIINCSNADGITALHQSCIDGSMDIVSFLLEQGANVNQVDSEGWTPLHVAASCGYSDIVDFLLREGASVSAVNCDGDVPLDIALDETTESLLQRYTVKQGVDLEAAKRLEEEQIMTDARTWLIEGSPADVRHPRTGATPLHVAAAKGYLEALKILCQCGLDVSAMDLDGWTPLHAAAHWGQGEACRILAEQLCNMEARSNAGQTPFDVADESVEELLKELSQKQANVSYFTIRPHFVSCRSSVCRMSSKEKMNVQDQSKERGVSEGLELSEEKESSPENFTVSSPESVTTSTTPEEKSEEEPEQDKASRTARVQPTPQTRAPEAESPNALNNDKRKFQAPVRDEESESQRKARSRLMRRSRRSTQGVTLTDLKEAEKTVPKAADAPPRNIHPVSPIVTVTSAERDTDVESEGEKRLGVKDRRRGRRERRSTGIVQPGGELYLKVLQENLALKDTLQEKELLLSQNKVELERLQQSQECSTDRPALLELERFVLGDLKADNQRLKDENAALIRVISKLSR
uniref:cGMP-dependent protein kinase interacting domain-containing protein n=1 Tax=Gasterosteus aculeatus aculeatus TaxID=481459 RepID=G3Q2A9_GASAC